MQVAVLSPHRDDAAFSCGLTLHSLLQGGNSLTVVNVCTISRYAPYLPADVDAAIQQVTEVRRNEDAAFCETLYRTTGAIRGQVEIVDLAWRDVPVRWIMEDHLALAPMCLPQEELQTLSDAFRALPRYDIVLAPMALGGHLDHRLVRLAAEQTFPASSIAFYEDLPYACRMPASSQPSLEVESNNPLSEAWLPVKGAPEGLKQEFALCYPSQIAVDVAEEMERYGLRNGGRERFLAGAKTMRMLKSESHVAGVVLA